jgi:hypothetical protein
MAICETQRLNKRRPYPMLIIVIAHFIRCTILGLWLFEFIVIAPFPTRAWHADAGVLFAFTTVVAYGKYQSSGRL